MNSPPQLIRLPEVLRLTGLSRSTVYRLEKAGRFVPRVRLSDRMSAWPLGGVVAWIQARPLATASSPLSFRECGVDSPRLGS